MMTKARFRRIYAILLTVSILSAGLCLMGACLAILRSGQGFSREAVAQMFRSVAVPLYLCLGLVTMGFLLELLIPGKGERPAASRQEWLVLRRLRKRTDISRCNTGLRTRILRERAGQRLRLGILLGLGGLSCGIFLGYLLSGDRFSRQDITGAVLGCVTLAVPMLAVYLGWALVTVRKNAESCRREMELLKPLSVPEKADARADTGRNVRILRYSVLAIAVFLVIYGFCTGGAMDVLTKAVNICTECIGLG